MNPAEDEPYREGDRTPEALAARERPLPRPSLSLFVVPPLLVFLLLIVSFALDGATSTRSIEVIVPSKVMRGDPIPILARLVDWRGEARFELVDSATVRAHLEKDGETLTEVLLDQVGEGLFIGSIESAIVKNVGFHGSVRSAQVEEDLAEEELTLVIREGRLFRRIELEQSIEVLPHREPLPLRALRPDPDDSANSLEDEDDAFADRIGDELRLFAETGRCVPEFECNLVFFGPPSETPLGERFTFESERGVIWIGAPMPRSNRALFRRAKVQNLHPLIRATSRTETRTFSVPIAPGGIASSLPKRIFYEDEPIELDFDSLGGEAALYALYLEGTLQAFGRAKGRLQLAPLNPGDYRLEIGIEPFNVNRSPSSPGPSLARSAAQRFIVVHAPFARNSESRPTAWQADAPLSSRHGDELWGIELLVEESLRIELPPAVGIDPRDASSEGPKPSTVRSVSAVVVLLIGLLQALWGARSLRRFARTLPIPDASDQEAALEGLESSLISRLSRFSRGRPDLLFALAILTAYALVAFIILSRAYIFL